MTSTARPPAWTHRNHWMAHTATHAAMQPEATALKFRGEVTTWSQLSERMLRVAAGLRQRGVGEGDRVALLTLNHPWFVEGVFGINSLGTMAVPLNFRLAPPELDHILADSEPTAVLVDAMLLPLLKAAPHARSIGTVIVIGDADLADEAPTVVAYEELVAAHEPIEMPDASEDATALLMYTSGTTGHPKGAMLSHVNMQAQALTCIRAMEMFDDSDVGFLTAPFFHIAGLGSIVANVVIGCPTVIHPLGAFDPAAVLDAYEAEQATIVFNVPMQWDLLSREQAARPRQLALRIISWGAAPASDTTLTAMAEAFPRALNVAVFGQTETSPITCVLRGQDSLRKLGSVGRPIPTLQYRVVDHEMRDVARGEVGEIVYRGPTVMRAYWNKPRETAEAFRGGWFHSGDLVKQDEEGFIWVVDRLKDMIISGGENIYCAEVENIVAAHPAVREVAVIGRRDERWGQVPVAAMATVPGASLTLAELTAFLDGRLASYKMPKDLVILDELPRNAGGKILKGPLRSNDAALAVP